ncbi:MAG: TetR family transcriptional regulator, partial [Mycobacterium sp.]
AYAVPRMLRSGRRAMVMQIDVLNDGDDEERLLASATVNFAVVNGATPKLPDRPLA